MKFLVVFFFAATMMTATVLSQTTESAIDNLIDQIEDELNDYTSSSSPSSSPTTTTDYYTSYLTPDYYSSYYSDYDDTTTVKPFKQQLLSLFFNKKAGLSGK